MRLFVFVACAFLLAACSTPRASERPPAAVTLAGDLHFKWFPPNASRPLEIFLSAGRYVRSSDDGNFVYYEAGNGMVSAVHVGDPAQKVKGGIGYSKKKRRYFVWEFAPSFVVRFPLNGFSDELEDGPTVKLYLGGVPKEIEPSLHFEP